MKRAIISQCLTQFYRKAETVGCDMTESYKTQVIQAHVFNQLLDYIEDKRGSGTTLAMANLTCLYDKCLLLLDFPTSNATQHALERILSA